MMPPAIPLCDERTENIALGTGAGKTHLVLEEKFKKRM